LDINRCSGCGGYISRNEILIKQLTDEKNLLHIEIAKLTKSIILYDVKSNEPDVVLLRTLRTKRNEKVTYITNLTKNLQHQMKCEKSTNSDIFINYLINELTKSGYSQEHINHLRKMAHTDHANKLKKAKKEIHRIYNKADVILSHNEWRNSSGCFDPTAKLAIDSVSKGEF